MKIGPRYKQKTSFAPENRAFVPEIRNSKSLLLLDLLQVDAGHGDFGL
jgi:hypothetical protein